MLDRAADALESGTIDAREDTTLNWMPMAVDAAGWEEVTAVFEAAANRLEAIHALCRRRMDKSGEEAIPMIVGMAGFEPAPEGWEVGDPTVGDGAAAGSPEATSNGSSNGVVDAVGGGEGAPTA